MNPAMALRLAQAIPETRENFSVRRELIQLLQNLTNAFEKDDDE